MIMNLPFLHFDDVMEDSDPEYFEYEDYDLPNDYVTDEFFDDEGVIVI